MRCTGRLHERIVKLPHSIGEEFSGLVTAHGGVPGVRPRTVLTSLTASGSTRPCCRTWLVSSLTRSRIG
jgi:hypothetical protein